MSTSTPRRTPQLTVEDYLELEEASSVKHEYVAGQLFALSGASERHNRIDGNIFALLWNAARHGPCRVYGSDMRLRIGDQAVYYPDVQVVCEASDNDQRFTTTPCLIVEVLSPSTKSIDLREKLLLYRDIKSLRAYMIVFRDEMRIVRQYRAENDAWYDALHFRGSTIPFPCPEVELPIEEIYEAVETS